MRIPKRTGCFLVVACLLGLPLTDRSGQDVRFYGRRADREFESGKASKALETYQIAYRVAVISADTGAQMRLLNNIGGCQVTLFRYRDAARTLLRVRNSDEATHNSALLGGADGNLATVYSQLGELQTAEMYARESVQAYSKAGTPRQRLRAVLTLARIHSQSRFDREAERLFLEGIRWASAVGDWSSVSYGWRAYGQVLLENGQLEDADRAFEESRRRLYQSRNHTGEDALLWNISRLRLRQSDSGAALKSIDSAIKAARIESRIPPWRFYQTRAQIELARGDAFAALDDARLALKQARAIRVNVIPDNETQTGAEGLLDEAVTALIDAGNQVYLTTGEPALLAETFEASEENRAESLEGLLPTSSDWRVHLPAPQYWDKLAELLAQERQSVRLNSEQSNDRFARLHSELSEMEATAKATVHVSAGRVLDRVEKNLPAGAVLLSFRLGERASWLWVVERGRLELHRLPAKTSLLAEIEEFEDGIQHDDPNKTAHGGRQLYEHLFGNGGSVLERSSQWFISADDPLYAVPLAALVVRVDGNRPVYLTQEKTLQVLPGAQMFEAPARASLRNSRLVAAGDGIYNRADPRYGPSGLFRQASWSMARLPGSGAEVRFAAALWRKPVVLTGAQLTRESLIQAIDRDPDVIHIASHVIPGQERWRAGILALGMDKSGEPDLLTPQEILLHPIHSRLVVMTGCSSGSGESLPASGLMGLTRAWLAAGAGEVLATRWATRDEDSNGLIGSFYRHLLASPDGSVPEALREARLEMLARGGWRAEPSYWSSFFLIGVR